MAEIGPYSRAPALAKMDGRSSEARLMRKIRNDLVAHVGGKPSVTQSMLIERIVNLSLRVATMDRKFTAMGTMTEHDTATYLAWSSSLSRLLRELGLKGPAPKAPTLAEVVARGKSA
ncbi:MAG: hypothetical protein HIU92_02580 [Proteobacteria bacterium]|nr:hypothetical protein [Pseudomonadota bacterium]